MLLGLLTFAFVGCVECAPYNTPTFLCHKAQRVEVCGRYYRVPSLDKRLFYARRWRAFYAACGIEWGIDG